MNVLFINTFYYPSHEEFVRLANLQTVLTLAHAELSYNLRNATDYQKSLSKMRYHEGFRSRLVVVNGMNERNSHAEKESLQS